MNRQNFYREDNQNPSLNLNTLMEEIEQGIKIMTKNKEPVSIKKNYNYFEKLKMQKYQMDIESEQ